MDDDSAPLGFDQEESADLRRQFVRHAIRISIAFAVLFAAVYFAFWWSGSAVRFGAAQAAGRVQPAWHVIGTVRDAATGRPIPWARVEDDPAGGHPPLFRTDADQYGAYDLLTLVVPHPVHITSPGYHSATIWIGRTWFLWMPKGEEHQDVKLIPD